MRYHHYIGSVSPESTWFNSPAHTGSPCREALQANLLEGSGEAPLYHNRDVTAVDVIAVSPLVQSLFPNIPGEMLSQGSLPSDTLLCQVLADLQPAYHLYTAPAVIQKATIHLEGKYLNVLRRLSGSNRGAYAGRNCVTIMSLAYPQSRESFSQSHLQRSACS